MTYGADTQDLKGVVNFVLRLGIHDLVHKERNDGPPARDDQSAVKCTFRSETPSGLHT